MKKLILPPAPGYLYGLLSVCVLMESAFKGGLVTTLIIAATVGLLAWILHISRKLLHKYFAEFIIKFDCFWDE